MFTHNLKESFRHIPIKWKLILLMMVLAAASVILTTMASTFSGIIYLKHNEENELTVLAELIGDKNAAALAFQDQTLAKANLSILASKPSVRLACIYDMEGNIFAKYLIAGKKLRCPRAVNKKIESHDGQIEIFHRVEKNGKHLGIVYLCSDLRAVKHYLHKQWGISAGIIGLICLVSYLMSIMLQQFISNPIKSLAEESKAIFQDNYSIRSRKIYEDELGDIADSFNKILEEREEKHQKFFRDAESIGHLSKSAQIMLKILDDEAIFPFKAASTFKTLLEKQVFGPVNALYSEYFHDVYTAEVQLYYVLAKAVDSLRLQSESISAGTIKMDIATLVEKVAGECFAKAADPRLSYAISASARPNYVGYKKPLLRSIETIIALFVEARLLGRLYQCHFDIKEQDEKPVIIAHMHDHATTAVTCNDNYLSIPLNHLIDKLKNNEEIPVIKQGYFINLEDVMIRSHLYSLEFLSHINHADIEVRLSPEAVIFVMVLSIENENTFRFQGDDIFNLLTN